MTEQLKAMLIRQEGLRLKPYRDSVGKLTVGVGRNLDDIGVSEQEAMVMLETDISRAITDAQTFPWFHRLDSVRQDVLVDMIFNMGLTRVQGFHKMLAALQAGDWDKAANEMLDSRWSQQVGNRALELAKMIRTGAYV